MKVLIADKFPDEGRDALIAAGCSIVYEPELKEDALAAAVGTTAADVLVVRSTKVSASMLESGRLSLVVRAGAGYNTIDIETAAARGIYVANCPGKNSIAVAELAFGHIIALDRRLYENTRDLKAGRWNKKEYSKARGLFGRTLGLIGLGQIGREMVSRAKAFGMPVIAWSRSLTEDRAAELEVEMRRSHLEVAGSADVVSIHVALKNETRGLIDQQFFDQMRPGSLFINAARAEVIDQAALERAVRSGKIRAALDVFNEEPSGGTGSIEAEVFKLDGAIGSHHIGASTDQAQQAIADETVRIITEYKRTGRAPNVVNIARKSPATHLLVVRHYDRVGVLADVFTKIRGAGINVQETENIVFDGARAAVARIHLDQEPPDEVVQAIRTNTSDIIDLSLVKI
ncbi:MAG TPA: 3-phosphoglycerate dehydrogenase family protein [Blastocatellia bacterium]|nr:3-phosphoglycerate dehydrogenase family protein [Blastocatellia bacterium]